MACSSTSSIQNKRFKYNVFLSFRGKDIRKTFIDHLYEALKQESIFTYKDDEKMEKGGIIDDELLKAIEESKFVIIVFSEDYASSSWCLNELVKIMECQRLNPIHQTAYPVFYHVDPREVRHQTGPFGEAFAKHNNKEEAGKWREALLQAGNLAGWDLKSTDGHEAKFIKKIVEEVSLKLRSVNEYINKKLVGMEARVEKVLSSLETGINDFRMIGIWGIGGGGKTTLARAVFNQISMEFEGKSFVENIREESQRLGLHSLQEQVLSDVLNYQYNEYIKVGNVDNGKSMIKKKLHCKKVLLVLDDVDHRSQIEAFAESSDWFKPGSRIIITTRDEQVLRVHRVTQIHGVNLLSYEEAICLLSRHAFEQDSPAQGYEKLSRQAVDYAAHLPLVISVLGGFLCGRDGLQWTDQLERLRTTPLKGTLDVLKLSYDSLEEDLKEMFLDIACFLKSSHKDDVVRILESCGFRPNIGLDVLEKKSLITFSDDQYLGMHDLIQEMGRNIVRHSHPHDPEKHSRLWILKEIEDILAEDLGTDETRAIAVDDNHVELSSQIVTKGFGNMRKIRFLRIVSKTEAYSSASQNLPYALQYLSWGSYPHWSLPNTFRANHLVALEMSKCSIIQLWDTEKVKDLNMLRFLNLSFSRLRTLDLGRTPNLEKLDLEECCDLEVLHTPVGCLKKLVSLNLSGCLKIKSFLFIKQLKTLEVLSLTGLFLEEFPDIIPGPCNSSLQKLHFRHNYMEELPSSIGNLKKLVHLDLHSCIKLKSLPRSICGLRQLRNLILSDCDQLEELPEDIDGLECLEKLNLSLACIKHLPDSICKLKRLKTLELSLCRNLEKLPEDIGQLECLQKLILEKCIQVRHIPDSICQLKSLKYLCLLDCIRLEKLPTDLGVSGFSAVLNVQGTRIRQDPWSISLLNTSEAKSVDLRSHGSASTFGTFISSSSSTRKRKFDHL